MGEMEKDKKAAVTPVTAEFKFDPSHPFVGIGIALMLAQEPGSDMKAAGELLKKAEQLKPGMIEGMLSWAADNTNHINNLFDAASAVGITDKLIEAMTSQKHFATGILIRALDADDKDKTLERFKKIFEVAKDQGRDLQLCLERAEFRSGSGPIYLLEAAIKNGHFDLSEMLVGVAREHGFLGCLALRGDLTAMLSKSDDFLKLAVNTAKEIDQQEASYEINYNFAEKNEKITKAELIAKLSELPTVEAGIHFPYDPRIGDRSSSVAGLVRRPTEEKLNWIKKLLSLMEESQCDPKYAQTHIAEKAFMMLAAEFRRFMRYELKSELNTHEMEIAKAYGDKDKADQFFVNAARFVDLYIKKLRSNSEAETPAFNDSVASPLVERDKNSAIRSIMGELAKIEGKPELAERWTACMERVFETQSDLVKFVGGFLSWAKDRPDDLSLWRQAGFSGISKDVVPRGLFSSLFGFEAPQGFELEKQNWKDLLTTSPGAIRFLPCADLIEEYVNKKGVSFPSDYDQIRLIAVKAIGTKLKLEPDTLDNLVTRSSRSLANDGSTLNIKAYFYSRGDTGPEIASQLDVLSGTGALGNCLRSDFYGDVAGSQVRSDQQIQIIKSTGQVISEPIGVKQTEEDLERRASAKEDWIPFSDILPADRELVIGRSEAIEFKLNIRNLDGVKEIMADVSLVLSSLNIALAQDSFHTDLTFNLTDIQLPELIAGVKKIILKKLEDADCKIVKAQETDLFEDSPSPTEKSQYQVVFTSNYGKTEDTILRSYSYVTDESTRELALETIKEAIESATTIDQLKNLVHRRDFEEGSFRFDYYADSQPPIARVGFVVNPANPEELGNLVVNFTRMVNQLFPGTISTGTDPWGDATLPPASS